MATYYKVVRVNRRGEYRSAIINGKACLRYAIGERTAGFEGMPVLIFGDEEEAQVFARHQLLGRKASILAGTAGNPHRQEILSPIHYGIRGFRRFWQTVPRIQHFFAGGPTGAPQGTYAADWFEPERVVQEAN